MTYREYLKQNDRKDARLLVCGLCNFSLTDFLLREDEEIGNETLMRLENAMRRLAGNEPLQYVLQKAPFYGREFYVDDRVLIPRFDTEILVNEALKAIPDAGPCDVLDLCTGSGAIGVTLSLERPEARVTLSDVSPDALAVAKYNAELFSARVSLAESDLFDAVPGRFQVIVGNPPYIRTAEIETLDENVRAHEPGLALDGGEDGLFFYRRIAAEAPDHLTSGGIILLEIGYDEAEAVKTLLAEVGFTEPEIVRDLAGLDRVVKACWNNCNN